MLLSKGENSSKYTVESIMRNIHCLNIHSHTQLMAAIKHLEFFLKTHTKVTYLHQLSYIFSLIFQVRIVVIDSIVAPFRLLRGKERTEILYSMLRSLQILSKDYNFAVSIQFSKYGHNQYNYLSHKRQVYEDRKVVQIDVE